MKMKKDIIALIALFFYVWEGSYTFHVFPWVNGMQWWYIPHFITLAFAGLILGGIIMEWCEK